MMRNFSVIWISIYFSNEMWIWLFKAASYMMIASLWFRRTAKLTDEFSYLHLQWCTLNIILCSMWQNAEHFDNENEQLCFTATLSPVTYTHNSLIQHKSSSITSEFCRSLEIFAYATLTRTTLSRKRHPNSSD